MMSINIETIYGKIMDDFRASGKSVFATRDMRDINHIAGKVAIEALKGMIEDRNGYTVTIQSTYGGQFGQELDRLILLIDSTKRPIITPKDSYL